MSLNVVQIRPYGKTNINLRIFPFGFRAKYAYVIVRHVFRVSGLM